jgi:predicted nucleic acid-binding protein
MRIYADTSVLVAWFHPADQFAEPVTQWCREKAAEFSWNPLLRIELRHNLRRLSGSYAAIAWHAYRSSETANHLRIGLDPLAHLLEWGDELSARLAARTTAGTWDCVHVAAAQHDRAQVFATCDTAQAELARLAKLPRVRLFR